MHHRSRLVRLLLGLLALAATLNCSLLSTPFNRQAAPTDAAPPASGAKTPVRAPKPLPTSQPVRVPTATSAFVSADNIGVDYTYTTDLITVLYPLYGTILDDYLVVRLENNNTDPARVIVESQIDGYTEKSIDTVDIAPAQSAEVRQNPQLSAENIDSLNTARPANVHLRVLLLLNGEEKVILDQTHATTLFARRDFPWAIEGLSAQEDFELLAAMVTPNDPAVEELIRAAADHIDSGIMTNGYGGHLDDEDGEIWARLEALWNAEAEDYQLTYISTLMTYAPGEVQRIRLPAEVLSQRSGNCVELALLFASAAEALELEPVLIRIPGHAYMAVRLDRENKNYYVIETTMIGRYTFGQAITRGSEELNDALAHIQNEDQYGDVTESC